MYRPTHGTKCYFAVASDIAKFTLRARHYTVVERRKTFSRILKSNLCWIRKATLQ